MERLQALIRSLESLYAQLSLRLLESRMRAGSGTLVARESAPIQDLLSEHIHKDVEARARPKQVEQPKTSGRVEENTRADAGPGSDRGQRVFPAPVVDALSEHFSRYRSATHQQPFMRDRMRNHTLDHINKALSFAKAGNEAAARVHAKLAESAMKTAGQYMSDEEYSRFREEVEARMRVKGACRV
jgi:hypothetical protein